MAREPAHDATEHRKPKPAEAPVATIGSPDVFLTEKHRGLPAGAVRILQVAADGPRRAYVIADGPKLGYFHLAEGMPLADAEAALRKAYDGTAVVV